MNVVSDYRRILERQLPPGMPISLVQRWLREGDGENLQRTYDWQDSRFGPLPEPMPQQAEVVLQSIGLDVAQSVSIGKQDDEKAGVNSPDSPPGTVPVKAPTSPQDGPRPETGPSSGGETITDPKADSGQGGSGYEEAMRRVREFASANKEKWEQEDKVAQMCMTAAIRSTVWTGNDQYLFEVKSGEWVKAGDKQLRKLYRERGMFVWISEEDKEKRKELEFSFFEKATSRVMVERNVDIVTSLAGYKEQILNHRGKKILVTGHPEIIQPVKGGFPTIRDFLSDLLQTDQQLNCSLVG